MSGEGVIRVALVSCVKSKGSAPAPARELYTSQLFGGMRAYAEKVAHRWYILSAQHGLVEPNEVLAPYERTLTALSRSERREWSRHVQERLVEVLPPGAEIIVLAGKPYREDLVPFLREHGFQVSVPLEGLSFGRQLQWLKASRSDEADVVAADLARFYEMVALLGSLPGQGRRLDECSGRSTWPRRGVYFFQEPGENRTGGATQRVVRVGTHAVSAGAKSRLWGRLRAHRGARHGGGNHRGSIFRLHVGAALLQRDGPGVATSTWGIGQSATRSVREQELAHERRVSEYIGRMSVLWVAVPDDPGPGSARGFIERNAIALLSNRLKPVDPPSSVWLGLHSIREEIRGSGLWNLNHVREQHDPSFLSTLADHVQRMSAG